METHSQHLKLGGTLSESLRLLGGRPLTLLGIGLIPAGFLSASFGAIVLGLGYPGRSGDNIIAMWRSLSPLVRAGFILSLLVSLALVFRGYAACVLVTSEWRQGRSVGTIAAYSRVRRKSLRILWICFLCGLFTGPFAVVIGPLVGFALAPGFPVAVLEGLGAMEASRRAWELFEGNWGRLVLVCVLYLAAVVALLVVWICTVSSIVPLLPLLIRPAISVLFFGLLLLPSQWFFSVLTLAYFDLKGQGDAAVEG